MTLYLEQVEFDLSEEAIVDLSIARKEEERNLMNKKPKSRKKKK